ncbi:MAG TPA: DUF669 domain-containing protein [Lysobacter sp.]
MANLNGAYDPNAEAQQDFAPLPTGEYVARITESDMKPTSNNTGYYLELVYEVAEGDAKGRKLWVRLNLQNQNDKTVEIANRQFASIREAIGVANPRDSQELHNKPHIIRVEFIPAGAKRGNKTYDRDTNEVKAWKKLDAATAPAISSGQASAGAAASTPPWKKAA